MDTVPVNGTSLHSDDSLPKDFEAVEADYDRKTTTAFLPLTESQPREPKSLMLEGFKTSPADADQERFTLDGLEKILERSRQATETYIEMSLFEHRKELFSDIRLLMCQQSKERSIPPALRLTGEKWRTDRTKKRSSSVTSARASMKSPSSQRDSAYALSKDDSLTRSGRQVKPGRSGTALAAGLDRGCSAFSTSSTASWSEKLSKKEKDKRLYDIAVGGLPKSAQEVKRDMALESLSTFCKEEESTGCLGAVQRLVESSPFEIFMGLMVCTNALFIGMEVNYAATHSDQLLPPTSFVVIGHAYAVVFIMELICRMIPDPRYFFCKADAKTRAWNYLDSCIVALSLVDVGLDVAAYHFGSMEGNQKNMSHMRIMRILRVFRLVRLLRMAKIVRVVRALRTLVYSILCTLRSVFWAMVLLASIIYMFAILLTQATAMHQMISYVSPDAPDIPNLNRYWGSIGTSMLSLFMSIVGGISWIEVMEPLLSISIVWASLFVIYICFTCFAVLNVVTGVFCQAAMDGHAEDRDSILQSVQRHKQLYTERFMEIFDAIDGDQSGRITFEEYVARMDDSEVKDYFATLEINCADALCLFDVFDDAMTEGIQVDEFVMGCLRLKGLARSSDMVRLLHDSQQLMNMMDKLLEYFDLFEEHSRAADRIIEQPATVPNTSRKKMPIHVFMEKSAKDLQVGRRRGIYDSVVSSCPNASDRSPDELQGC